jgi:hypothetical protein
MVFFSWFFLMMGCELSPNLGYHHYANGGCLLQIFINIDDGLQDRRIRGLLEACSLEHDVRMDALHGRVRERVQSDARWKQLQRESNKAVCELLGKNLSISAGWVWQIHFNLVNL